MTPEEVLALAQTIPIPPQYEWKLSAQKIAIGLCGKSSYVNDINGWRCYVYIAPRSPENIGLVLCHLQKSGSDRFEFGDDIEGALQFIAHRALMLGGEE